MQENKKTKAVFKISTKSICYCAMLVALTAAASQISVPIPFSPIPITLSILMILLCGTFGPTLATFSIVIYVFLGALGLPVFAGFKNTAALVSPTGGYILGYIPAAFVSGLAFKCLKKPITVFLGLAGSIALCYLCGTIFFSLYSSTSFIDSLLVCVVPFIPLDILKAALVTVLGLRLKKIIKK